MRTDVLPGFGYPDTLVHAYEHWLVLAAKRQITLGTLLVVERMGVTTLGAVSDVSWNEFPRVIRDVERVLAHCFAHDRMNTLFLMMATPEVHAAVIPRYAESREFHGVVCTDPGWPRKPDLDHAHEFDAAQFPALVAALRTAFASVSTVAERDARISTGRKDRG